MPKLKLILLGGTFAVMAVPCLAQEALPVAPVPVLPAPETVQEKAVPVSPPVVQTAPAGCADGGCAVAGCENPRLEYRVIWQPEATPVQSIVGKDILIKQPIRSMRVVTKPEKRLVTVYEVRQKQVERAVPVTRMVECVETDCNGQCHTVTRPVTEMKVIKDTEFYSTPVEKEVIVPVSKVEEFDDVVVRKVTVFGWRVDMVKHETPIILPPQEVRPDQVFLLPQPPCVEPYTKPATQKRREEVPPPRPELPGR